MDIKNLLLGSELYTNDTKKQTNASGGNGGFISELENHFSKNISEIGFDEKSSLNLNNIISMFGDSDSINKFFDTMNKDIEQNYLNAQQSNDQEKMRENYKLAKQFLGMQSEYEDSQASALNAFLKRDSIPPYQKLL